MNNDPELLKSYRNGEKKAFLEIYNRYSSRLRKFLHGGFSFSSQGRMLRFKGADSSMDAEAIVQETFVRAFFASTRANYDGTRPFQTYLFSIAKNLVLRECHHRDRLINVEHVDEAVESSSYPFYTKGNQDLNPELHLQNLQLKNLTDKFISSLKVEEKTFFTVRFAEGNTQEKTAEIMGTTRARIKLLEKNIRARFLSLLRKNGYLVERKLNPRWKRKDTSIKVVAA